MKEKILIVEDQFVEADYLRLTLTQAGYGVTGIARSVLQALEMIKQERPDFVLLDIFLKGKLSGIDLAKQLGDENIAFAFLSANSNEEILNAAKTTQPYGFLVKPFREKDLLITLEIARYRHEHSMETFFKRENILKSHLSTIITSPDNLEKKLLVLGKALHSCIPFNYIVAGFNTMGKNSFQGLSFLRIGFNEYQLIGIPELLNITGIKVNELQNLINITTPDTVATWS
ncbi:MAG TPA: response regulator, partial [Flavisolibacter sp.]|nr:response regulator [Flavisolibacter sp.]